MGVFMALLALVSWLDTNPSTLILLLSLPLDLLLLLRVHAISLILDP